MKNLSEMTADELHNQIAEFSAAVDDCVRAADEVKKAADNYKKLSDKYCDEMEKFLTELEKDVAAFKKKDRALTEEMFGNVKTEAKKHFEEESPKIYEDVVKNYAEHLQKCSA